MDWSKCHCEDGKAIYGIGAAMQIQPTEPRFYRKKPFSHNIHHRLHPITKAAISRRLELDLNQQDVATISGVHKNTVARFERGARGISVENVDAILGALGLRLSVEHHASDQGKGPDHREAAE